MLAASMLVASLPADIEKCIQIMCVYEHVLIVASMLADSLEKCVCYVDMKTGHAAGSIAKDNKCICRDHTVLEVFPDRS